MALALGCTLAGVLALSAAEFAFWGQFYKRFGFQTDRLEGAAAMAGAYVCQSVNPGSKVQPKDIIPRFGRRSAKSVVAAFAGIPGAKIRKREKKAP